VRDGRVRNAEPVEETEKVVGGLVGDGGHCGSGLPCGIALGRRSIRNRRSGMRV
jgi:hypothetical protein